MLPGKLRALAPHKIFKKSLGKSEDNTGDKNEDTRGKSPFSHLQRQEPVHMANPEPESLRPSH